MLPTPTPTPAILAAGAVALSALVLCAMYTPRRAEYIAHKTLARVTACLNPQGAALSQLLEERARANTRLVKAFNLTNTFVSGEESIHSSFVNQARGLLKQANRNGWRQFRDLSTQAVQVELSELEEGGAVPYDRFVQAVCLRVILVGLLGVDAAVDSFSSTDINIVTANINLLWSLSKTSKHVPPHLLPQLTLSLRNLVPDTEKYPNPVDFVIPAWETLWRVIAIAIAYSCQEEEMVEAFSALYNKPDITTFNEGSGGVSIRSIIAETMRLHPPSKRIGRLTSRPSVPHPPTLLGRLLERVRPALRQESAEVHTLQVSEDIWGPDAADFKPSRFPSSSARASERTSADQAHQLLFGSTPLRCIGASWAPVAAGVISSAIVSLLLEQEEGYLTRGSKIGGRVGWDDWFVRRV